MKYLVILLVLIGFASLAQQSFAWCGEDEDWPDAPCYAPYQDILEDKLRQDWAPYYEYKGEYWMEQKRYEMEQAIKNKSLEKWIDLLPAHQNVHYYYYIQGKAPDLEGKYVFTCNIYEDISRYKEILRDNMVLKKFLEKFPSAESSYGGIDESRPPQSHVIYEYVDSKTSASLLMRVFEGDDKKPCLVPRTYTLTYSTDSTQDKIRNSDFDTSEILNYLDSILISMSPLKQIQSGTSFDEIQCKDNLVLIQKYDGAPACVTESAKTKLIERGWTTSATTVTIYSNFEQNRDRTYTNPRNVIIDLEKNNSVKWVNNADYAVQVYDYENKSWSTGQIDPSMSDSIQFNNTGYYEFTVESANDRHFGKVVVISENTNSLPAETRMKMGMAIVSNDLGKNTALIGVGTGDVNDGIKIDINKKELEKRDDAESFYYNLYNDMIPFDVPITIEFSEPIRLHE